MLWKHGGSRGRGEATGIFLTQVPEAAGGWKEGERKAWPWAPLEPELRNPEAPVRPHPKGS